MVDVALRGAAVSQPEVVSRARILDKLRGSDNAFRHITRASAIAVLVILGGVILSLIIGSWPALREFGFDFLLSKSWNPVTEKFGALAPIYGTVVTSLIAMAIAVPIGLLITLFLTELCPMWLRRPIGIAVELLAGIPSIIYGIWGLFVLAPLLQVYVYPWIIDTFEPIPILSEVMNGRIMMARMMPAVSMLTLSGGPANTSDRTGTGSNPSTIHGSTYSCSRGANTSRPQMP